MAKKHKTIRRMAMEERGGFTIIEVILVLAIAGLIFLMVFIALPTLQRSQRDTERESSVSRLVSQLERYRQNNSGNLPEDGDWEPEDEDDISLPECPKEKSENKSAECFILNYMNSAEAEENKFVDPSGAAYGLHIQTLGKDDEIYQTEFDKKIYVYTHATCDGERAVYSKNRRDYAVVFRMEGSGTSCRNNN